MNCVRYVVCVTQGISVLDNQAIKKVFYDDTNHTKTFFMNAKVSVYAIYVQSNIFCIEIKYEITDPFVHDRILIASWKTAYTRYVGNP